jgi:putative addiction module component (TIGR02574 family)
MINTEELFSEAISLPIEARIMLVNKLLESLNPSEKEIDALWAEEAEERIADIRSGKGKTIPGEEVFKEIREKYNK